MISNSNGTLHEMGEGVYTVRNDQDLIVAFVLVRHTDPTHARETWDYVYTGNAAGYAQFPLAPTTLVFSRADGYDDGTEVNPPAYYDAHPIPFPMYGNVNGVKFRRNRHTVVQIEQQQ